jgi:predicted RNase H-like HicB family nuclease
MNIKYAVVFEKAAENRAAYVPDVPGCITTGKSLAETASEVHVETQA